MGVALSTQELVDYSKEKDLEVTRDQISKIRREWKFTAKFEKTKTPPSYIKTTHFRYGICQIDMAFLKDFKTKQNKGMVGFVVCVEINTRRIAIVPIKSRSSESWKKALAQLCDDRDPWGKHVPGITTLLSDQESALNTKAFKAHLRREHGVTLVHLTRRHKAYLAEVFISVIKRQIGMAVAAAEARNDPESGNWIRFVPVITRQLNSRTIPGTKLIRNSISAKNFSLFLEAKLGKGAYSALNLTGLPRTAIASDEWKARLFKYKPGDRVLVNRRVLAGFYRTPAKYFKPSVIGGWSEKTFAITRASLKRGGKFTLAAVYKIKADGEREEKKGWFYSNDLLKV